MFGSHGLPIGIERLHLTGCGIRSGKGFTGQSFDLPAFFLKGLFLFAEFFAAIQLANNPVITCRVIQDAVVVLILINRIRKQPVLIAIRHAPHRGRTSAGAGLYGGRGAGLYEIRFQFIQFAVQCQILFTRGPGNIEVEILQLSLF